MKEQQTALTNCIKKLYLQGLILNQNVVHLGFSFISHGIAGCQNSLTVGSPSPLPGNDDIAKMTQLQMRFSGRRRVSTCMFGIFHAGYK
jgi:hypothetical protein